MHSYIRKDVGGDWYAENMMLANRVGDTWSTWKGKVSPVLTRCSEEKQPWLVRSPTGKEREEVKNSKWRGKP
jgi:hypothetical protein